MKTFEERYTAWIDGQLEGGALTDFERELAQRAEAGDAEAAETDKADALHLRALLKEHLQAPVLTNAEFFNHQMRERIDAEATLAARRREAAARPAFRFPAFAWPFLRVAGVGAAGLFVVGALYYGMAPLRQEPGKPLANNTTPTLGLSPSNGTQVVDNSPAPTPPSGDQRASDNDGKYVKLNTPTPTPLDLDNIQLVTPNPATSNTSATKLRFPDADVIWLENLRYLPNVTGTAAPSTAPAANVSPAPQPSAAPSATP